MQLARSNNSNLTCCQRQTVSEDRSKAVVHISFRDIFRISVYWLVFGEKFLYNNLSKKKGAVRLYLHHLRGGNDNHGADHEPKTIDTTVLSYPVEAHLLQ